MGRLAKGALFVVAVLLLGSLWEVSVVILAYLFIPLLVRRKGERGLPAVGLRGAAGVVLLLLAAVAVMEGGRLSPFAFGVPGVLLLAPWGLDSIEGEGKSMKGSILVRRGSPPFRWGASAELKFATRDPARALSGVEGRLLVVPAPPPRVFAIFGAFAFSQRGAERKALAKMGSLAWELQHFGVYVMPLDSSEWTETCGVRGGGVTRGEASPASGRAGASLVEAKSGIVVAKAEFRGGGKRGHGLGRAKRVHRPKVFLWEFLRDYFESAGSPRPDELAAFLSGAAATSAEGIGDRVTGMREGEGGALLVSTPGGTEVTMTRAQLSAVLSIYHRSSGVNRSRGA